MSLKEYNLKRILDAQTTRKNYAFISFIGNRTAEYTAAAANVVKIKALPENWEDFVGIPSRT